MSSSTTISGAPRTIARPAPARLIAAVRRWPLSLKIGTASLLVIAALCYLAPLLVSGSPTDQNLADYLQAPSAAHPLGTDATGRDQLMRIVYGGRPSLAISALGMTGSVAIGVFVGMLAAFGGALTQRFALFVIDVQLALPYVLVAIVLVSVAGASIPLLVLMMALAGWVQVARVVRSIALRERAKDYVKAATVAGATRGRIAVRYVLPVIVPAVIVLAPLQMAAMLVIEATLSFLGMGIKPPAPSWGGIMLEGKEYLATAWWITALPGLAIVLTSLSLLLVGNGLQRLRGIDVGRLEEAADTPRTDDDALSGRTSG